MWITTIWEKVKSTLFGRSAFEKSKIGATFITDDMAKAINEWALLYANKAPWLSKNPESMGLPSSIARELATLVTLEMQANITDPTAKADEEGVVHEAEGTRADFIRTIFKGVMEQLQVQKHRLLQSQELRFLRTPRPGSSGSSLPFVPD